VSTLLLSQSATGAAPLLRTVWLLGLPLAGGLWAAVRAPHLGAAMLFGGGAAALLPAAMLETALPVVLTHAPGGGSHVSTFFWQGLLGLVVAGLAAALALLLHRRAEAGVALPQAVLALLFAAFYAAVIVPRHTAVADALMPGVGGAADPLAPLTALAPAAPWIAAGALAAAWAVALATGRTG
jgi:hypothetical protein